MTTREKLIKLVSWRMCSEDFRGRTSDQDIQGHVSHYSWDHADIATYWESLVEARTNHGLARFYSDVRSRVQQLTH